jgi:ABC-2 type transport system ATP-binding protein
MSLPAVLLEGVTKVFGPIQALKGLSAAIHPGCLTGIIGTDGAGKTTLMRLMAGLMMPSAGHIRVLGLDTRRDGDRIADLVGYMPQRFGLYEDLRVMENLRLYAALRGMDSDGQGSNFDRLLAFTRLGAFSRRLAGDLSGGMKQKLGLACALLGNPRVLLLDEPSVGVDPVSRQDLWGMVAALTNQGLAVVWATAYLDEAERCATVLLLNAGQLVFTGPPGDLTRRIAHRSFRLTALTGNRRALLQQALDLPAVRDGVLQGAAIRVVLRGKESPGQTPERRSEGRPEGTPAGSTDKTPEGAHKEGSKGTPAKTPTGTSERTTEETTGERVEELAEATAFAQPDLLALESLSAQAGARLEPLPPRFEDAFVDLLGGGPGGTSSLAARMPPVDLGLAAVVECHHLTRRFGSFTATDDVSFQVRPGEIFGLLGPNGAGKSTTFRMLCGLLKPSAGEARVAGLDLRRASGQAKGRLGYMAQKFSLYGLLSVRQNLTFYAGVQGLAGRDKRERIDEMVETFQLQPFLDRAPDELPLGFKQRLALACALMHRPPVLFLDEPTSGVDPLTRREFWTHINGLVRKGVTILVTTHFMDEAEYCDRMALMYQARVIALDTPDALKAAVVLDPGEEPTMEQAFIRLIERSDGREEGTATQPNPASQAIQENPGRKTTGTKPTTSTSAMPLTCPSKEPRDRGMREPEQPRPAA